MFTGEERVKGIRITKSSGTLNITVNKITVYKTSDNSVVTAQADTEKEVVSTTVVDLYKTIVAGSSTGGRYIIFKYHDGVHIGKVRLDFHIVQG